MSSSSRVSEYEVGFQRSILAIYINDFIILFPLGIIITPLLHALLHFISVGLLLREKS